MVEALGEARMGCWGIVGQGSPNPDWVGEEGRFPVGAMPEMQRQVGDSQAECLDEAKRGTGGG